MSLFVRRGSWMGGFIAAIALILLTPTHALAQNKPGTWDVTPFLNFNFGSDLNGVSPGLGVAGGYNWSENLAFEGEFSWIPDAEGGDPNIDEPVVTLSGNGVYYFYTGTNFTPYATLGIGIGHTSISIKNPPSDTSSTGFQENLGGGVKAELNPRLTVRGDLRYFHLNDQPSFWRFYGGVVFQLSK
jgi:opacity protein-like surface antigen